MPLCSAINGLSGFNLIALKRVSVVLNMAETLAFYDSIDFQLVFQLTFKC